MYRMLYYIIKTKPIIYYISQAVFKIICALYRAGYVILERKLLTKYTVSKKIIFLNQ